MKNLKKIRRIFYKLFKLPLILIFLKTPLIIILKNRFKKQHFTKKKNFIISLLDNLFFKEYFLKISDPVKQRELTNFSVSDGYGKKWAQIYYDSHFLTLKNLNSKFVKGNENMILNAANPIYSEIITFIEKNKIQNDQDYYLIQIGSASGRDLEFFYKMFPNLKFISTDINDEIINFQKDKYKIKNFFFFKCYAEELDKCFSNFELHNKKLILISIGSLQYVIPHFLQVFFEKLNTLEKFDLFIQEPVDLNILDLNNDFKSESRGKSSFTHNYKLYSKKYNLIKFKIVRPYIHKNVGNCYLHISKGNNN